MSNIVRLREQVAKCRRLARMSGDAEIERRLTALADEYEALRLEACFHFGPGSRSVFLHVVPSNAVRDTLKLNAVRSQSKMGGVSPDATALSKPA